MYSYYIFEFNNSKSVKINKYLIKTYNTPDKDFPRSWVVSGFNGKKWINISTVIESSLNSGDTTKSFDVDIVQPFYKIKITQIRETYSNRNHFCMSNIEFFGSIGFHRFGCNTTYRKKHFSLNVFVIILLNFC